MQRIIIYSCRFGGPYKQYKLLKKHLESKGHQVKLYNRALPILRSLLFERKDVVISLLPLPFRFGAKKYILNIKGEYLLERSLWRNQIAYLYPRAERRADGIVVPSVYLKEKLKLDRARVLRNGIELMRTARKRTGKTTSAFRIITTTSFAFEKKAEGVVELAKALEKVKFPTETVFDIYGGGTYLETVRAKIGKLHFPKHLTVNVNGSTDDVQRELLSSDLFLYWSEHDNLPNAVLEAMAAGLPVIANDVGAMRELIDSEKDGLIVSRTELPSAIERLGKNKTLRSRLGKAALAKVKRKFEITRIVNDWMKIIG
jgi:glycosyltransferase involved in cell wall biosynthesis